ncbi:MAG: hypothetical protein ACSW8F_02225 [bacterium]
MKRTFFLGANGAGGFVSLYPWFTDPVAERLLILKGGPGSGKSTFLRLIAGRWEEAGGEVEYIRCSGDPDSLDGVKLLGSGLALVDGTSPHVVEPTYAGSGDNYIDLSQFYNREGLRGEHGKIVALTGAYKGAYQEAYRLLHAAKLAEPLRSADPGPADALAAELFPVTGGLGRETRRFLSAISCQGRLTLWETVEALAERVYLLAGDAGSCLARLAARARAAGQDFIRCQSPLAPEETEALLLPELSLAFVPEGYPGKAERVSLSPATPAPLSEALIDEAIAHLREAKELHDELEAVYNPFVDFAGVRALAEGYPLPV